MESFSLFAEIMRAGVNIATLTDNQIYKAGNTDFPQLVYSLTVMSRANEELQTKSMRVGAAWANKRKNAASTEAHRNLPSVAKAVG